MPNTIAQLETSITRAYENIDSKTNLVSVALRVEELKGKLHVLRVLHNNDQWFVENGKSDTLLHFTSSLSELCDVLLRGADDSWSGRNNDAKRAYFDGVREQARSSKYDIESKLEKLLNS